MLAPRTCRSWLGVQAVQAVTKGVMEVATQVSCSVPLPQHPLNPHPLEPAVTACGCPCSCRSGLAAPDAALRRACTSVCSAGNRAARMAAHACMALGLAQPYPWGACDRGAEVSQGAEGLVAIGYDGRLGAARSLVESRNLYVGR